MITITISGPAKSGKSMLAMLIATVLDSMMGVTVRIEDEGEPQHRSAQIARRHRIYPIAGIGDLLRKMLSSGITIKTVQTAKPTQGVTGTLCKHDH